MSELKPCPFCGGEAELLIVPGYFTNGLSSTGWMVKCKNGCCDQMIYSSDHDTIEAWNKRATIEPEQKKGEWNKYYRTHYGDTFCCNKCGGCFIVLQGSESMNFCPNCGTDMRGNQDEQT